MPDIVNIKQPTNHAEYVGAICNAWAGLELAIDSLTWWLSGLKAETGACITSNFTSIFPKIDCVIKLCSLAGLDDKSLKKIRKFKNDLHKTADKRIRFVHDTWMPSITADLEELAQWDLGMGKDMSEIRRSVPLDKLLETLKEIENKQGEFMSLRIELTKELKALRQSQNE